MSTRSSATLTALTRFVHEEFDDRTGPLVLAIVADDDAFSMGLWEPEGPEPLDSIIGWIAPVELDFVGLHTNDDGLASTTLVDRRGALVTIADGFDDPVPTPTLRADGLLRSRGLPTPPPPIDVPTWLDLLWLDRLAVEVFAAERSLDRDDLLAAHPLHRTGLPGDGIDGLRRMVDQIGCDHPWSEVRARWLGAEAPPARPPGGIIVAEHRWFDDGSFVRHLLAELPPPSQLLGDLALLLPGELLDVIGAGLAG